MEPSPLRSRLPRLAQLRRLHPPRLSPERRERLGTRFRGEATSKRGQAQGLVMMITPAIAHPLPLPAAVHTVVLLVAVVAGSAGALIVFGGLAIRVLEPNAQHEDADAAWNRSYQALTTTGRLPPIVDEDSTRNDRSAVDDALLALPHRRAAWLALVLVWLCFSAGAIWCFVLLITGNGDERLPDALLLGLPALALGWASWRGRIMWTAPSPAMSPATSP